MAKRQESGGNAAHQNQRPTSHDDDAMPEMTDDIRGRADEDDEFEDSDELDEAGEEDEIDEGSY
jgi:hypothetical protein